MQARRPYQNATFVSGTVLPSNITVASTTFPVSSVNMLQNTARSWYDAGYVNLRRRYAHSLSLLVNYTFAKNLSNAPDFRSPMFESAIPQNDNDLEAEKGPSCDVRQRLSLSAVYEHTPVDGDQLDTVHHTQLEALLDLSGAVRHAVHDIGLRRHRQHWHSGRRERDSRELHRTAGFRRGHRHHGRVVQSGCVRYSRRIHVRQPGTQHRLRTRHADHGRRAGSLLRASRSGCIPSFAARRSTR